MRDSFIFYRSFAEALVALDGERCKEVLKTLCDYALDDTAPGELDTLSAAMFALIKPQIDANNRRRENGKNGAAYGKLGGRPKKPQENPKKTPKKPQENPKETPKKPLMVNDNDNDNDNDNVKDIYNHRFSNEFDDLWSRYPRKQGKANALKSYIKARKSGVTYEEISQGLDNYNHYLTLEKTEQRYIKQGSTWFSQQCWNDDYVSKKNWTTADIAPMLDFSEFML